MLFTTLLALDLSKPRASSADNASSLIVLLCDKELVEDISIPEILSFNSVTILCASLGPIPLTLLMTATFSERSAVL